MEAGSHGFWVAGMTPRRYNEVSTWMEAEKLPKLPTRCQVKNGRPFLVGSTGLEPVASCV